MTQPQSLPGSVPAPDAVDCTPEDLEQYRGNWIAFSADGSRIIASSPTLAGLDDRVRAAGEDPEQVLLERIPGSDSIRSGSEVVPDAEISAPVYVRSPRLAHCEQAGDFTMEVVEGSCDADV